jgi:hypothetical protein
MEKHHCQQIKDLLPADEGVGVAENPPKPACGRRGVGARGSSVKNGLSWAELMYPMTSMALPLLNLLTVRALPPKLPSPVEKIRTIGEYSGCGVPEKAGCFVRDFSGQKHLLFDR